MTNDAPKIPNVEWRKGRPRFSPGEPIRKLGYKAEDLKRADGSWMSAGEALDWALVRAEEIAAKRADLVAAANKKRPKGTKPVRHAPVVYTLAKLFEDWQLSPKWKGGEQIGKRKIRQLADNTRNNYRWKMKTIETFDQDLYQSAVDALDPTILFGLYEELYQEKGLSTARGVIATISSAISWGIKRGKVKLAVNPALALGMEMPEISVRFAEREEIAALVAAADAMGRPEIGDMVNLGVWTGQRQNDRLVMIEDELMPGRVVVRQSKTGAIVDIGQSPELRKRLAAAKERRRLAGIESAHLVIDEKQGTPWLKDHYRHTFADVRALAVAGWRIGETAEQAIERAEREKGKPPREGITHLWKLPPCPSLATLHDRHFRATAVVWMALADATPPQIISVTGHTLASASTILKHYLPTHPDMADTAIGKMIAWFDAGAASQGTGR